MPGHVTTSDPVEICEHLDRALFDDDSSRSSWLGKTNAERVTIRKTIKQINAALDAPPLDTENPGRRARYTMYMLRVFVLQSIMSQ